MTSVLQDWLAALPWKQQSILFSGLRGPDAPGCPAIKSVNRWMRTVTQHNADPSKDYMKQAPLPEAGELCDELEFLPVHYVHHFADALAVIAYGHPDPEVCGLAADYHYLIAEELFHFQPETPSTFRLRHRDKTAPDRGRDELWASSQRTARSLYMYEVMTRFQDDDAKAQ